MILNVYSAGSADPSHIAKASKAYGGCVFIVDPSDHDAMSLCSMMSNFGQVVVGNEVSGIEREIRLLGFRPEGVVAFSEARIELAISLADIFRLPRLVSGDAAVLVDKWLQRCQLNSVFEDETFSMILSDSTKADEVPYPNVIKPRRGAGSTNTVFTTDHLEFEVARSELPPREEYVLEEELIGAKDALGDWLADNISVESVVQSGEISILGFSGRLTLAEPARDTGLIFPIIIPSPLEDLVVEANRKAILALQLQQGIVHAEFKICESGPRVIEVNGRLGGGLARLVPLTLNIDPVEIAVTLSVGNRLEQVHKMRSSDGVAGHIYIQAPMSAVRVVALPELDEIRTIEDVVRVDRRKGIGDSLDWRNGTMGRVFDVWIHSSNLDNLQRSVQHVDDLFQHSSVWDMSSN